MVLRSGTPFQMKYVVLKLWLRLMSLFQPIDQLWNNLFLMDYIKCIDSLIHEY